MARFALPYLEGAEIGERAPAATRLETRWILSRLASTIDTVTRGIDEFRLDDSTHAVYRFVWNELCDWYVELCKPVFQGTDEAAKKEIRDTLAYVLEASLRLLHPFIPFITEELWQKVPRPKRDAAIESIVVAPFPKRDDAPRDEAAERDMNTLQSVIGAARTIRSEHGIPWASELPMVLRTDDPARRALLEREMGAIVRLVNTKGAPSFASRGEPRPAGAVMSSVQEVDVLVSLLGLVDGEKERERVEREIKKVEKDLAALEKKLSLPSFADKAPKEVVDEANAQVAELGRRRAALDEARSIATELSQSTAPSKS